MKKIIFTFLWFILSLNYAFWATRELWNQTIKEWLLDEKLWWWSITSENTNVITVANFFRDSIFQLLLLISIWVFLWIWIRLATARWNPEELKKAFTSLVYAVVWLFIVSAAWAMVKLVSGLSL